MSIAPAPAPSPADGPSRLTREEYYRLAESGVFDGRRVERIRGEVVEMSPQGWPHLLGKTNTADALRVAFAGVGWVAEQSTFPTDDSDPEPDVAVYPGRKQDYTDLPTAAVLMVEVSDTTLTKDTTVKAEVYATAGVPDYWVLDINGRQLIVFRNPQPIPDGGAAYRDKTTLGPADTVSPLHAPHATITVADLLP